MKIRKNLCWLLMAALLMLWGCGRQEEETAYTVYYTNTEGTRLMEVSYSPTAQTFDEIMQELMDQMANAPSGYVSALSSNVKYNGFERGIDALRIDFSKEYYNLSNTEEVLCRAAVVKTVSQIPGVTKVMLTVEKEQLKDRDGGLIPAMDANTFIDTKEGGINSYLYTTLKLYFPDRDGSILVEEPRELHYSSNMVLERVVVEQLLKGPETSGLRPIVSEGTKIQNIYVQNGICNINFDAEFNKTASENALNPEIALYAIVNSLCDTCDNITGVQFEINGESDIMFRDRVNLDQVFEKNTSLIEAAELQSEQPETEPEMAAEPASPPAAESVQETVTEAETQKMEPSAGGTVVGVDPSLTEG